MLRKALETFRILKDGPRRCGAWVEQYWSTTSTGAMTNKWYIPLPFKTLLEEPIALRAPFESVSSKVGIVRLFVNVEAILLAPKRSHEGPL